MIHIGAWHWGAKYPQLYIDRLRAGIARNLRASHRVHFWEPLEKDRYLAERQGCFARLRAFDPEWQSANGIQIGDKIVVLDLDLIITGSLDALFESDAAFTILQGVNAANPCPYNGSLWMLRAGYRSDVWADFTLERARDLPYYIFPDDQCWLADRIPDAAAFGPENGVYGFQKPGWPGGNELPKNARIVAFPGRRDPGQFVHLPWVRDHWRE